MASRASQTFAVLGEPEFRKLFLGQAISAVGSMFTMVALPFAVLSIGGSPTDIGLVLVCGLVPLLLLVLVGGVWADRLPRRLVMLVADVARATLQSVAAVLLVTGTAHVWHLALLQVLMGTCEAFFWPAYNGLVPQTVSPARLQQANALYGMVQSGAVTAGAALGGLTVAAIGAGWAIGIDSVSYLFSAWFLWRLLPRQVAVPTAAASEPAADGSPAAGFLGELREGWREFTSHTWLWAMVAAFSGFLFLSDGPINVLGPIVAKADYDGPRTWGFVLGMMGIGQLAGGVLALRWRPRRPLLVIAAGLAVTALPTAFLALRAPLVAIYPAVVLMGVEWGLFGVFWMTCMQQQVAPEMISRVSAYDILGSLAFYPAGLAMAGPLATLIGVNPVLWVGAAVPVAAAIAQLLVRDVRTLELKATADVV